MGSVDLVGAVDQGTSSTRFLIFNSKTAELITYHQVEINQLYPHEGWVEEDPIEILESVKTCIENAVNNLSKLGMGVADIKCVGITNQRETTVVWDKLNGQPLCNAIVWLDMRTASTVKLLVESTPQKSKDYLRPHCGLPITTYFSAVKLRWLLDNNEDVQKAVKDNRCLFGTVDSWILWNLTGGIKGGHHLTDVTNASRTMLMNINTLKWDDFLCRFFKIPKSVLPEIRSSSEIYGYMDSGSLKGKAISGILGDQQAALVGQACFKLGQAKNTYGTGCFLLYNTGCQPVESKTGLLTTVAYQMGPQKKAVYALEGAVAIAGACVRWLRDNLGIISTSDEVVDLASTVNSTHGCYFVPAFSGLFCPYWQDSARGIICGLSQFTNKNHIARAALEAVCFQTREVLEAMNQDSGIPLTLLQVDGGMTTNSLLMQLQADILQIKVVRPSMPETTALGAAMAAGAAEGIGVWNLEHGTTVITTDVFSPSVTSSDANSRYIRWKNAVERSMNWEVDNTSTSLAAGPETGSYWNILPFGLFLWSSFVLFVFTQLRHLS